MVIEGSAKIMKNPAEGSALHRLVFIDVLNIVSSFAVVLLHTSLGVFSSERSVSWVVSLACQSFAIFAVPIFFMVSGMNLLTYRSRYSTKEFFRKRFLRVGLTLLGASLLCYLLFFLFPGAFYGADLIGVPSIKGFIKGFLTNGILDIYWFMYAIIYLYVLTPLLALVAENRRLLEYTIVLCLFAGVAIPLFTHVGVDAAYFQSLFGWTLFANVNLLYYLLGHYLNTYVRYNGVAWGSLVLFFACGVMMLIGSLWEHEFFSSGSLLPYNNYLVGISSPLCVVEAVALFRFARSLEGRLEELPRQVIRTLTTFSQSALGVYLFHMLLVNWIGGGLFGKLLAACPNPLSKALLIYLIALAVISYARYLIKRGKRIMIRLAPSQRMGSKGSC